MPFCPKNKKRSSYCHGYRDAGNVSLRSVLILFWILHVETMFGNEGEGFLHACISSYNIALVNSECWLAKSRVDITLCQHGKFPAALNSNSYRPKCASYIVKKKIKHFPCWYIVISTLVEIGKTRNCVKTLRPSGVVFPHNFSFFQFPLVLI